MTKKQAELLERIKSGEALFRNRLTGSYCIKNHAGFVERVNTRTALAIRSQLDEIPNETLFRVDFQIKAHQPPPTNAP